MSILCLLQWALFGAQEPLFQCLLCSSHVYTDQGLQLKQVDKFTYLGSIVSKDGSLNKEIDRRINLASLVARELGKGIIGNLKLSKEAQISIYRSLFKSTLTYGHETWILTERIRSRVQAAEMRFLRKIVGVTRLDQIRNTRIREELNLQPLLLEIEKSQLKYFGHARRMPPVRMVRQILDAVPTGRRPVGRPRQRWLDQIKGFCERIDIDMSNVQAVADDRDNWRRLVSSLPPRPERTSG